MSDTPTQDGTVEPPTVSPGRRAARVIVLLVLAVIVLYALFFHIFPWVERSLNDPTLGAAVAVRLL